MKNLEEIKRDIENLIQREIESAVEQIVQKTLTELRGVFKQNVVKEKKVGKKTEFVYPDWMSGVNTKHIFATLIEGDYTNKEIVEQTGIKASTVTGTVSRFKKYGILKKVKGKNHLLKSKL